MPPRALPSRSLLSFGLVLTAAGYLSACGGSDSERSPTAGATAGGAAPLAGAGGSGGSAPSAGSGGAPSPVGAGSGGGPSLAGSGGTHDSAGGGSGGASAPGGTGGLLDATSGAGGAGAGGSAGSAGGGAQRLSGSIVPLYTYPSDPSWTAIISAAKAHPSVHVIAIINPNSGPGAGTDAEFTKGAGNLVKAGIVPIGYVSTDYGKRGEPAVKADIDKWRSAYPSVSGIFFDEESNSAGEEPFYRNVSSYAKSKGFTLTVGNPGTGVPDSYLDTVDIMLCYESAGVPSLASLKKYAPHREHFAIIPYATKFDAAYAKSALDSVAYVYLQNDDLPNPWDTLPASFGDLLTALAP